MWVGNFYEKEIKMASKKPKSVSVSGLSVNDIMEIDLDTFNKLGEKDLRAYTSRLVSASNKRIRRLEKHGIVSPAYSSLGTDVRFSTKLPKGTSKQQRVNALRNEFARARNFLSMKTSTLKGYKSYREDVKQTMKEKFGDEIEDVDLDKAHRILTQLQKRGKISGKGSKGSEKAFREIVSYLYEHKGKGNVNSIGDYLESQYQKTQIDLEEEIPDETDTIDI